MAHGKENQPVIMRQFSLEEGCDFRKEKMRLYLLMEHLDE